MQIYHSSSFHIQTLCYVNSSMPKGGKWLIKTWGMTPNFHFYANSSRLSRPSVYLTLPPSLSFCAEWIDGGRKREEMAGKDEKTGRQRHGKRAGGVGVGVGGCGGDWRGDTPADDRLMNLWIKSASAVLWTAADNNEMSARAKWKWRTADFGPARKFERRMEGSEVNKCEQAKR